MKKSMTYHYGVIGDPIAHSLSPLIHQCFAKQQGIDLNYQRFHVDAASLKPFVEAFFAGGGRGLNVTAPHKQTVLDCAGKTQLRAQQAGAANTLLIDKNNHLFADNTDGVGLIADLRRLGVVLRGKRVLVLGAGGAVKGVLANLLFEQPKQLLVANRSLDKAIALQQDFKQTFEVSNFEHLTGSFDFVLNGLSNGIKSVQKQASFRLTADAIAYDLNYGKRSDDFAQWMKGLACASVYDGLGMLWFQAAESYFLWHQFQPRIDNNIIASVSIAADENKA